jgi:hypothetical protein
MIPATAPIRRPGRGLDPRTRTWWRGLANRESGRHLNFIDRFLRRGRASSTNWISNVDDILFLGCDQIESALTGLLGAITAAGSTVHGSVVHTPRQGVMRSQADDAVAASYVGLGVKPSDLGWTSTSAGFAIYSVTDYRYIFREFGRSSVGLVALNASNGLRGYVTMGGVGGKAFTSPSATGWFCFTRDASGNIVCFRDDRPGEVIPDAFSAWPTAELDLLSAEPTGARSPNGVALLVLHHCTTDQCLEMGRDALQYAADAGFLTAPAVRNPGVNCMAESDLADVTPSDLRIFVSAGYPPANGAPPSAYPYYPMTDSVTGGHSVGSRVVTLATNAFTTTNASNVVTVTDPGFLGRVGDLVVFADATSGNGLAAADINGRREILSIIQVNATRRDYTIAAGTAANASGAIGGAACQASYILRLPATIAYTPARSGGPWLLVWDNRGKPPPDHPQALRTSGGGNGYGGGFSINRIAASDDGLLSAGKNCRPGFTNWAKAVTATEAQVAKICGYAARSEPADDLGQGYLDILENGGSTTVAGDGIISTANAMTVGAAWMQADTLFTSLASGWATAWDLVIWYPINLADITGVTPKGIMFDFEPYDYRPPAQQLAHMQRLAKIAGNKGYKVGFHPNVLLEGQMAANGFDSPTLNTIINDANVEAFGIITQKGVITHPDVAELIDYQVAKFAGSLSVPASKLLLTVITQTAPKFTIDDSNPLGPAQLSVAQCTAIAGKIADVGIKKVWIGFRAGGDADQFVNHQLEALLPSLAPGSPATSGNPTTQVDSWISTKKGLGGADPSAAVRAALINMVAALMDSGWWDRLVHLTWCGADDVYGARVDLRQLLTGSFSDAPTLTPLVCMTFDGVNDAITTGFVPASHPLALTTTSLSLIFYETANTSSNNPAMATATGTNGVSLFNPRNASSGSGQYRLQSSGQIVVSSIGDSRGLWALQRSGSVLDVYHDGEAFSLGNSLSSFTTSATLPTRPLRIGCNTPGIGTDMATGFRPCAPSFAMMAAGGATANDHRALKIILDAFLAAVAP